MEQKDYRLAAIMYTDIHGFSRMMEKDEAGTLKLLSFHNDLISEIVKRHNGTVIKTIGDALLIDFKNTVDALNSALEVQDELYTYNKAHPELPLLLRIGVHLGDIYFYENDALGEGINIASRLQSIAHPGCICMSQDVYSHVLNKIDFTAEKLGRVSLKNISKEIHAYEIVTPNAEFDPNRDKPKPGYEPGSHLAEEAMPEGPSPGDAGAAEKIPGSAPRGAATSFVASVKAGKAAAVQAPPPVLPAFAKEAVKAPPPPRTAPEASTILDTIRKSILEDIKAAGRRLSVTEAREKYGVYGPEAEEVIANLAMKGILTREARRPPESIMIGNKVINIPTEVPDSVVNVVSDIERRLEDAFSKGFERQNRRDQRRESRFRDREEKAAAKLYERDVKSPLDRQGTADELGEMPLDKHEKEWDGKLEKSYFKSGEEDSYTDFELFTQQTKASAKRAAWGFRGHFVTYAAVIGFLAFINLTVGGAFPWFLFPLGGWGIGIVQHFAAMRQKKRKAAEVQKIPKLNPEQLKAYKNLNRARNGFALHKSSTIAISAFLAMINIVTGGGFFWAGIPIAALVFSLISHRAVYGARRKGLEEGILKSLGVEGSWNGVLAKAKKGSQIVQAPVEGTYGELCRQATETKNAIIQQIKSSGKKNSPVGKDIIPALEEYVETIRLLASHTSEIDRIIVTIPMNELKSDKEKLKVKLTEKPNERMRREYEKSIEEIEQQEKSFKELQDQREMLELRIKSSVNALKQMQIDIARLKTMPEENEDVAVTMVKQKTFELFQYLEDLKTGYLEMDSNDPFAELERQERERVSKRAQEARLLEQKANELILMSGEVKTHLQADGYYQPVEGQPAMETGSFAQSAALPQEAPPSPPAEDKKPPEGQSQAGA